MKLQPHPTFGKSFQRFFLRAWILAVVLIVGSLFLLKNGSNVFGGLLAVSFGLSIVGTLGYLFFRLFNVACPICGLKTKTTKDKSQSYWIAICKNCDVTWDLGVGVGSDD